MATTGSLGRLKARVAASLRGKRRPSASTVPPVAAASNHSNPDHDHGSGAHAPGPGRPGANTGGVVVAYEPNHDGDADPGEVVWTWVAYEDDPNQGKDRPVLILGHDGARLVGVQLSSKDHSGRSDAGEWLEVGTGAWDSQRRASYVDASRLLRIDPAAVRREGAALPRQRFDQVIDRVTRLHDWTP
ncbi:MAG: type II toxin-antitoxin system PemK/MazF family toxin [Aquihabitans sp.]